MGGWWESVGEAFTHRAGGRNQNDLRDGSELREDHQMYKAVLKGIPKAEIINLGSGYKIPPEGLVLSTPNGWRGLYTPLLPYPGGELIYFRS